jgi:hypothetical protein
VVVEVVFLFRSPVLYLDGIQRVNADHDPNYQAFFAGEFQQRFLGYFPGAYLLKEPLAAIAAAAFGLWAVLTAKKPEKLRNWFLLLAPAVLMAAYIAKADNMGVRYLIPVLPFAFLLGGAGLAWLFTHKAKWGRPVAVVLAVWVVVAAAGIYPDHLSYFNESACLLQDPSQIGLDGGSRCGISWLDDSNVDWGQGLKQLRTWLDRHGIREPIQLAYFGSFPPQNYGLQFTVPDSMRPPAPGIYAVSAHFLPRLGAAGSWIPRMVPTAVVGHAIYVYVVR